MRQFLKKDKVILSLFLLAGIQLLVLGFRVTRPVQVPLVWPQEGDTLPGIPVFRSGGPETQLLSGEPTVLLIFHSRCVHCAEVASLWKSWLQADGSAWRVLAVSSEPLDSAQTYVERQGWEVDVGVVEAGLKRPGPRVVSGPDFEPVFLCPGPRKSREKWVAEVSPKLEPFGRRCGVGQTGGD